MVKQSTVSINLLHLARTIAVVLLICFFLPWLPSIVGSSSGASTVVDAALILNNIDIMPDRLLILGVIIGLGFIPIGSLVILFLSYCRRFQVPSQCVLTGVIGIIPFIIVVLSPNDIRKWYFPMILTAFCLLALIFIGATLQWKSATNTPSSAF